MSLFFEKQLVIKNKLLEISKLAVDFPECSEKINDLIHFFSIDESVKLSNTFTCSKCSMEYPMEEFRDHWEHNFRRNFKFCNACFQKILLKSNLKQQIKQVAYTPITDRQKKFEKLIKIIKIRKCEKCKRPECEYCYRDEYEKRYSLNERLIELSAEELNELDDKIESLLTEDILNYKAMLIKLNKKVKEKLKEFKDDDNDAS